MAKKKSLLILLSIFILNLPIGNALDELKDDDTKTGDSLNELEEDIAFMRSKNDDSFYDLEELKASSI